MRMVRSALLKTGDAQMTEHPTIFQMACALYDATGLPVFPVLLYQKGNGRWEKKPLARWSRVTGDPRDALWQCANAIGVPMGHRSGLIALDLDDYKDGAEANQWLKMHKVPRTRTHATASGGRHLIFRMPKGLHLGNRAPAVKGLDIRANGGFIVWADLVGRYCVLDDSAPALLPDSICAELYALQTPRSGREFSDANLPDYRPVNSDELQRKLDVVLSDVSDEILRARFAGNPTGLKDTSRSAIDMSLASLLAIRGFDFSEIFQTLMEHFHHGTAERDGWCPKTERAAMRCAARAVQNQADKTEAQLELLRQTLSCFQADQKNTGEIEQ